MKRGKNVFADAVKLFCARFVYVRVTVFPLLVVVGAEEIVGAPGTAK
jgi:hypothetical protein